MITGRDELFSLIQSMSKSEKRYFKMEAKRSGEKRSSNYLKLFDALNDMDEYDEAHLRHKFRKEKFIDHLPSEKRYLYQAILKSLRHYRSEKSANAQIKEMILDAGYLRERGLYSQALKMLKKARKQADHYQDALALLEINLIERVITLHLKEKRYDEQLGALKEEKQGLIDQLREEFHYLDSMDDSMIKVIQTFKVKDTASKELLKLKVQELEQRDTSSMSSYTLYYYYSLLIFYHELLGQAKKTIGYCHLLVEWWDERPQIKEENFTSYRIAMSNLINSYYSNKQFNEVLPLIEKLEREEPKNFHEQSILFQKVSITKLLYYMNVGDIEGGQQLIEHIQAEMDKYQSNKSSSLSLMGNIAIYYFSTEQYHHCLTWLSKIINETPKVYRHDIQFLSRLLNIICHFEIGSDSEILESLLRATYRFSSQETSKRKKKSERGFELEIVSRMKKLLNSPDYERKKVLEELQSYLKEITPGTKAIPGADELLLWVNSKITNRPLIELIRDENY